VRTIARIAEFRGSTCEGGQAGEMKQLRGIPRSGSSLGTNLLNRRKLDSSIREKRILLVAFSRRMADVSPAS
jgi:hypothetical protein